jgi:outer membrane protein OmpA-like peptidoglycan-associated protein
MKNTWTLAAALLLATTALGCAPRRPPSQLTDARTAYQLASTVPGAAAAATDLYEARQALDAAEAAYSHDGPNSNKTKNLAYIAHRKAIAAMGKAETVEAVEEKRMALLELQRYRDMQAQALAVRRELERAKGALTRAQQEADAERQARAAAEAKVRDVLTQIEGLKAAETERGLVLTLQDGVLFTPGKSQLTPDAKKRLTDIAAALKNDKRNIIIVGHTDATGGDDTNMTLSQTRANAVRIYLMSQGIDEKHLRAEGMGKSQPVADNKSAEGRAANRRVEIILEKLPEPSSGPLPSHGGSSDTEPSPKPENRTSPRTKPANPMPAKPDKH